MISNWIRTTPLAGLGVAVVLALSAAGCGGKATDTDDAVIVPAPDANLPASGTSAPTANAPAVTGASGGGLGSAEAPAAAPTKAGGWGTLKGTITLKGTAPKPKELAPKGNAAKDPTICAVDAPILSERLVVDAASKGVKNVLVYLPKPTAVNEEAKSQSQSAKVVFDQEKCVFVPHVLGVMTGITVELKNSDPANHNINSRLKNNGFNKLLSATKQEPLPVSEAERTPGELTCDIHPWMKAYWMVLDNPYFAVTDASGSYEIKNVPAGTQKVVVWQEAVAPKGFVSAPSGDAVLVKADDATTKDFVIDAGKLLPE
jgi:plastocyanin